VDGGVAGGGDGGDTGVLNAHGATWVLIDVSGMPFTMGSPEGELGRDEREVEHEVTLSKNYWMMTTEVTQGQFLRTMGYSPSFLFACGMNCPVERVTWHELAAYANALSVSEFLEPCYACTGSAPDFRCSPIGGNGSPYDCFGYRLPTEAEWEYAARAGELGATYNGEPDVTGCEANPVLDSIAWYCGNSTAFYVPGSDACSERGGPSSCGTQPVAGLSPNPWGLHDMLGNVFEWCHDYYTDYAGGPETDPTGPASGTVRLVRGGSFSNGALAVRAAYRNIVDPDLRVVNVGGRLVRSDQ
jgi:formylglycine-generating enzyme required for sulfatase activity